MELADNLAVPAAQYLRVSTEQQECSLRRQEQVIQEYARSHGFEVVESYIDSGRSGVVIRNRPELIRLLRDVITGEALFCAVLVYDVSRWGRFQDCDESAHYEFICKSSGIPVHYCAESFSNDDSPVSSIVKALKRMMAAEYSRELGTRCFAGSKKIAEMGYKQGGEPGYGLRRLLISCDGQPKKLLTKGDRKTVRTDRVLLVPGPEGEVECIREMYRLLVFENKCPTAIANDLNRRGIGGPSGRWRKSTVERILTHPKYSGCNVWNRTSGRLGGRVAQVPKPNWVVISGAFESLIEEGLFNKAQLALAKQRKPYSREEVLDSLRKVLVEKGRLSFPILKESNGIASINTIIRLFGSLRQAFELAGQKSRSVKPTEEQCDAAELLRKRLIAVILDLFPQEVSILDTWSEQPRLLQIDGVLPISIAVCPGVRRNDRIEWFIDRSWTKGASISLVVRLRFGNVDYHIFPTKSRNWIRPGELRHAHRLVELAEFCAAARTLASAMER